VAWLISEPALKSGFLVSADSREER